MKAQQVPLGGYAARKGAPATGVHDPVYARALVLAEGETKVGIVSVDLCFLPANVAGEIGKRVQAAGVKGLDAAHLLLCATHTHSAPDPLAMHSGNTFALKDWPRFDPKLLAFTAEKIAAAIVEADRRLVPARVGSGSVSAGEWNRNRRGEKLTDPEMSVLKVTTAEGRPLAAIVNFAAHPTLFDDKWLEISADWPGVMTNAAEKAMGGEAVCLFLNGAEGDASPNGVDEQPTAEAKVTAYGSELAKIAGGLLGKIETKAEAPLMAWQQPVSLPPRKPSAYFVLAAAQFGVSFQQAKQFVNGLMPEKTQLSFAQIGDLLLMGFPCEPTAEIGLAAKAAARKAGFQHPAIVALTNDWLAYALTPEQYRAGKYEASMSFYGDQLGPTLLTALNAGLRRPSAQKERQAFGRAARLQEFGKVYAVDGIAL